MVTVSGARPQHPEDPLNNYVVLWPDQVGRIRTLIDDGADRDGSDTNCAHFMLAGWRSGSVPLEAL